MKPLFLNHTAELGGAELELLDHAKAYPQGKVLCFVDGPLVGALREAGVDTGVQQTSVDLTRVKRGSLAGLSPAGLFGLFRLAFDVAKQARAYDVIFANTQKAFLIGALAGRLAGRPVVWRLHDIMSAEHFGFGNRKLMTTAANLFANKVLANSEATADAFVASGGQASRAGVVYNGIDPNIFASQPHSDIRNVLGVGNAPLIGCFSRLAPWKGQRVLLEALVRVPGAHALLVGGALFGEEAYEASLRDEAKRLGIDDRVHFLGFRRDIPALMLACDVIAHTSVAAEPFGRVIVEGMLAGKPVVVAHAGAAAELIEDRHSGLLVTPGDAGALAGALRELLRHPDMAAQLARQGQERAYAMFSLPKILQRFSECLLELEAPRTRATTALPSRSA